ncbi:MAG: 16S rRNA (cytidine(1402)-2'-O)-methyltransferase [Bacteroidales bacterium]|nr:16S rRNA (cytidine(1402)-2'-O)-methyltransferase [Bacteroidales bacterium]MDT8430864.1 16S rRNA (cytidine(1402)-2'-O)-methyltransferase [Bacteroidales bacterium]
MSKLYLIPTPIGNLEDITLRAKRILSEVDLVLAEDTRKTGFLLKHLEISKPLRSHHKFNEHKALQQVIDQLLSGSVIGLVTDAGTPGISDPGFLLVRECIRNNINVETLPGATAFIPALVNSGLPADRFVFEGFLPPKKGRQKRLLELQKEYRTIVLYESPYKLVKTLRDLKTHLGEERNAAISRELTKIYEENLHGTLATLSRHFSEYPPKGEFVIVVQGR